MISTRHKFIFVHDPKTGGNSIQTILEPYSDDHKELRRHQDGIDRFNIKGLTPRKHATLSEYRKVLGDLADYRIAACCRHPIDRLLSSYFSPHRWFRPQGNGWTKETEYWDRDKFLEDLPEPASNFFTLDGVFRAPDVLVRVESFGADFAAMLDRLGLPVQATAQRLNASRPPAEEYKKASADPIVREIALSRFRDDFDFFGYRP